MDDLQGGVLTLEHRYEVRDRAPADGVSIRYRGTLHPSGLPIDIWVLDVLDRLGLPAHVATAVAARLRALSRQACRLRSPYVLRVIDYGEIDSYTPFQITDAAAGPRLDEIILHQGRLPLEGTARVVRELAEALDEAHTLGFGHLAVRPECVWFEDTPNGTHARLGCWGHTLLRHELMLIDADRLGALASRFNHLAPETFAEQAAHRWLRSLSLDGGDAFDTEWGSADVPRRHLPTSPGPEDPVAFDVFGLAMLTWRCLTGHHPFLPDQDAPPQLAAQLRALESGTLPDPSSLNVQLPPAVWTLLRAGLARDPGARPASALDFARQLEAALNRRPTALATTLLPAPRPASAAPSTATPAAEPEPAPTPAAPAPTRSRAAAPAEAPPRTDDEPQPDTAEPQPLPMAHRAVRYLAAALLLLLTTNLATLLLLGAEPTAPLTLDTLPDDARWTRIDDQRGVERLPDGPHHPHALPPGRYRLEAPGSRAVELLIEHGDDGARNVRLLLPPLSGEQP